MMIHPNSALPSLMNIQVEFRSGVEWSGGLTDSLALKFRYLRVQGSKVPAPLRILRFLLLLLLVLLILYDDCYYYDVYTLLLLLPLSYLHFSCHKQHQHKLATTDGTNDEETYPIMHIIGACHDRAQSQRPPSFLLG